MIMKLPSYENGLSVEFQVDASTSEQSTYDQETTSSNVEMLEKRNVCNSLLGIDPIFLRMVLAEALGTFLLMFCICGMMASMEIMGVQVGLMEYATIAAPTVVVVVFSIGPISGAHINPAVTLAFAAVGHFPWSKTGPLSGFLVGVAIGLAVLISGPVSGGSMNPARSLGPAIVAWKFNNLWIYVIAPIIGAVAGVVFYRFLRLQGWSCKPNSTPTTYIVPSN
ncbi:hypothetical protein AABB24_021717 [Solanum stoloniferum]|uniref:Uncharacterized protein n=1 Tax=Solanum stoloniferum TaxID=62892 RepID=A0ABD2SWG3_9SOLN